MATPTWKKVIVSGSSAHLQNVTASNLIEDRIVIAGPSGSLESTDLIYSASIFKFGEAIVSGSIFSGSEFSGSFFGDGSGLTGLVATLVVTGSGGSGSVDLKTESLTVEGTAKEVEVLISGSAITIGLPDDVEISGSLVVSGSITGSEAKFDYIFVSGAVINDLTASYAMNAETTALNSGNTFQVTPATASWIITHSLNTKYPIVEVWDSATDRIIGPDEITSIDLQTIKIDFTTPIAGWANISRAGHVVSGSILWENIIEGPSGSQVIVTDTLGITGSLSVTGSVVDFTGVDAISGSVFSGSFVGDGSGLTGIAATLNFSGSEGNGAVDLKTETFNITGSANGIVTSGSGTDLYITLDDHVIINQLTVATASITGSFSGSFFGDGTGLTGVTAEWDGTHEGDAIISGSLYVTGSVVDFTKVDAISGSIFSGSFVGDGSGLTGIATSLIVSASDGNADIIDLKTEALSFSGSANEIDIIFHTGSNTIQIGLPDNVTIKQTLTVEGDLIVNGETTVINTTEVLVEDKFIMLASGSTAPTDGGIIVQSSGSAQGYGFGMDASAERWALQKDLESPATDFNAPDAYVTATQFGAEATQPQYPSYGATGSAFGNIWVSTDTGDIFIWA
jgi:hypothetical protein